jgi:hypothetical protein
MRQGRKSLRRKEEAVNHKSLLTSSVDKELDIYPLSTFRTLLEYMNYGDDVPDELYFLYQ